MIKVFKPTFLVAMLLAASILLSGCQTMSPQQRSALGTTVGSVAGALVGSQVGGGRGQLVAIALGAAVGGLVGNQFANYLNEREQESLARSTQLALSADDDQEGIVNWKSNEREEVAGEIRYGRAVSAADAEAANVLGLGRGELLSSEERMMLARLDQGTQCRPTRTNLSVEERGVANGAVWCRTSEGDYKPLDQMAA